MYNKPKHKQNKTHKNIKYEKNTNTKLRKWQRHINYDKLKNNNKQIAQHTHKLKKKRKNIKMQLKT